MTLTTWQAVALVSAFVAFGVAAVSAALTIVAQRRTIARLEKQARDYREMLLAAGVVGGIVTSTGDVVLARAGVDWSCDASTALLCADPSRCRRHLKENRRMRAKIGADMGWS